MAQWQTLPLPPKPPRSGTPLLAALVVIGAGVGGALVWLTVAASQARGSALEAAEAAGRTKHAAVASPGGAPASGAAKAESPATSSVAAPSTPAVAASGTPAVAASGTRAVSVAVDVAGPGASASAPVKAKGRPGTPPKPPKPESGPIKESLYEDR